MKYNLISLGCGCDIAFYSKKYGYRNKAYPFDKIWNYNGGLNNICNIIYNDFKDLTENIIYNENNICCNKNIPNMLLVHNDIKNKKIYMN